MESISQLRKLCQSTRPSIFSDFLSRIYYKLSIYFTWACLHLKMSANQVTILSGLVAVIGGALISSNTQSIVLLGALFFHLFAILDMSDGEVARYRKEGGVTGHYLDWYMHFISSTALMIGLFIAVSSHLDSPIEVVLGLIAVVIPILDKTVQNAGWTVICWTRLRDINNNINPYLKVDVEDNETKIKKHSWLQRRLRFLLMSPLQDHWAPLVLLLLAMIDLLLSSLSINFIDYRYFWLLYVGIIGPIHIFFRVRYIVNSYSLQHGYKRLIHPNRKMIFPEDDFLS